MFKHIHPHARLWIVTVIIIGFILAFKPITTLETVINPAPKGTVIAYYTNGYQLYAIEQLTKQNKLEQYPCLYELWQRESNWRPAALNKGSHAFGIAQLLPQTWKLIKVKPTKDGFKQIRAGLMYIDRHYGTTGGICKAYAHHLAMGWY